MSETNRTNYRAAQPLDIDIDTKPMSESSSRSRPTLSTSRRSPCKDMPSPMFPSCSTISPLFPRKRVAKACDQCRRRKSKCDGSQSCASCTGLGLQCSFGNRVKQTKGTAYVAYLEQKIDALEAELNCDNTLPDVSTEDYSLPALSAVGTLDDISDSSPFSQVSLQPGPGDLSIVGDVSIGLFTCSCTSQEPWTFPKCPEGADTQPRPCQVVDTVTREPQGKPLGLDILRQLCNIVNQMKPSPPCGEMSPIRLTQAIGNVELRKPQLSNPNPYPFLPLKQETVRFVDLALTEAFTLWPCIDREPIRLAIDRLYDSSPPQQEQTARDYLALLYALLALGQRFATSDMNSGALGSEKGLIYFSAARELTSLASCDRSLMALQTVICLSIYFKAACDQISVHAYITAAVGAALRMGLHMPTPLLSPADIVVRRRVWLTIQALDIYVSSSLGVPFSIPLRCRDHGRGEAYQPFATETPESAANLVDANSQAALLNILCLSLDKTYFSIDSVAPTGHTSFQVPRAGLEEASDELRIWSETTPSLALPVNEMTTSQLLLAYAYDHTQLLLFLPLIHHLTSSEEIKAPRCTYGIKCLDAAKHAVKVAETLHEQMSFHEAYFLTIDTLALATMALAVVELGCRDTSFAIDARSSACSAKDLFRSLSRQSTAAAECSNIFLSAFDSMPTGLAPAQLHKNLALVDFDDVVDFSQSLLYSIGE